jgi:hypothetical protein
MTDSCVLFDLPEAIAKLIILEWLYLHFVVRLDSALCNGKLRSLFTDFVYGHRITFSVDGYGKRYKNSNKFDAVIRWAILRTAKLDGIHLDEAECSCNRLLPAFLATNGTAIRWVASSSADTSCGKQQQKLEEIARRCPHVERLHIDSTDPTTRWNDCLLSLTQAWKELSSLSLCGIMLSEDGLVAAVGRCMCLGELVIRSVEQTISAEVMLSSLDTIQICSRFMSDDVLAAIARQCPLLEVLKVFESSEHTDPPLITDVGVRAVLWGCPRLRETDVEYARGISNHLRVGLARRRNDSYLCLSRWRDMSEELVRALLDGCPRIKDLYFCRCDWLTDATLAACARNRPRLETIGLVDCSSVSNDGISALVSAPGNRFRRVLLCSCPQLGDAALSAVATHCPLLVSVTLSKCPLVTDSGVVSLVVGLGARLRCLNIHGCKQLGDKVMNAVAEHCPLLEELRYPYMVSDAAVDKVWERCVHLKRMTPAEQLAEATDRRCEQIMSGAYRREGDSCLVILVLCMGGILLWGCIISALMYGPGYLATYFQK